MKKTLLGICLLSAGLFSANTEKDLELVKVDGKETTARVSQCGNQPVVYTSTCGMHVTTTPPCHWGFAELIEWRDKIEANYCEPGAPYSNTSGIY